MTKSTILKWKVHYKNHGTMSSRRLRNARATELKIIQNPLPYNTAFLFDYFVQPKEHNNMKLEEIKSRTPQNFCPMIPCKRK